MKIKTNFFINSFAILLMIGYGIFYYYYNYNNSVSEDNIDEVYKDDETVLPNGWIFGSGDNNYFNIKSVNSNDSIDVNYYNQSALLEISHGKYGKISLQYSIKNDCWLLGSDNSKSGFVQSCAQFEKSPEDNYLFSIYNGYGYVIARDLDSFVVLSLIGDDKLSLKEVANSIKVGNMFKIQNITETESKVMCSTLGKNLENNNILCEVSDGVRIFYIRKVLPNKGVSDINLYYRDLEGSNETLLLGGLTSGTESDAFLSIKGNFLYWKDGGVGKGGAPMIPDQYIIDLSTFEIDHIPAVYDKTY